MNHDTLISLIAVIVALGGVTIGGLSTWFSSRRRTSGKIGTSDASTLWAQAQEMRSELLADKNKVEEQRDRLIESQAVQVLPMFAVINDALKQLSVSISSVSSHLERVDKFMEMCVDIPKKEDSNGTPNNAGNKS